MSRPSRLAVLALLAGAGGCSDRADPGPTAPPDGTVVRSTPPQARRQRHPRAQRAAQERWPAGWHSPWPTRLPNLVKAELDRSTVVEHKLHFQRLAALGGHRVLQGTGQGRGANPKPPSTRTPARRRRWSSTCRCRRIGQPGRVARSAGRHGPGGPRAPVAFDTRASVKCSAPTHHRSRRCWPSCRSRPTSTGRARETAARGWRRRWRRRPWHRRPPADPGAST